MPHDALKVAPPKLVTDALAEICAVLHVSASETIDITQTFGRVTAAPIIAQYSHPAEAISAMDGFAIYCPDAGVKAGTNLQIMGEAAAGHVSGTAIKAEHAMPIFTGAHIPQGAHAVALQEDVLVQGGGITLKTDVQHGQFIRPQGLDFHKGDRLIDNASRLGARQVALAALSGQTQIEVRKKPRIALIASGDELVPPGQTPQNGQLVNSNSLYLRSLITHFGGDAVDLGVIGDRAGALTTCLEARDDENFDMIISTGGASVGKHDHIVSDLQADEKSALHFWRIAMRPGKPVLFGHFRHTPFLGLPGNPVSAGVCALVFIWPMINHSLGLEARPPIRQAELNCALPQNDGRQDYLRAIWQENKQGKKQAMILGERQDSSMMQCFAQADMLIIRPPFAPPAQAGEKVDILPFPTAI